MTGRSAWGQVKTLAMPLMPVLKTVPLVLPAAKAQLIKQPLASRAVAAAGAAGAAALCADRKTLRARSAGFVYGLGQRVSQGFRGAAMVLRRTALGGGSSFATFNGATALALPAPATPGCAATMSIIPERRSAMTYVRRGAMTHVSRHVVWLSASAARATGAVAAAASRGVGALMATNRPAGGAGAGFVFRDAAGGVSVLGDSTAGGSSVGNGVGGRQTLRLPLPRLSWIKRNSNAMLVRC